MKKEKLPLAKAYLHIHGGPVLMISSGTMDRPNIMTIAWSTMLDFTPPVVGCCIGDHSYTFEIIKKRKEFVINIPTKDVVVEAYGCGSVSGRKVDKFKKFDLTPVKGSKIDAPMIAECYANFECKVIDTSMVKKYNLFIAEVVAAWVDPKVRSTDVLHHVTGRQFIFGGKLIKA